ncbi:MAG: hypothetical protein GXP38_09290 [Chloroflexi bacterium]|nr:hypothetical protein [Chloroflexota bacterium]
MKTRKLLQAYVSTILALSIILTGIIPVSADGPTSIPTPGLDQHRIYLPMTMSSGFTLDVWKQYQQNMVKAKQYGEAIKVMERYIYITDQGLLALPAKSGGQLGINEQIYQELVRSMEVTNRQIQMGILNLSDVQLDSSAAMVSELLNAQDLTGNRCPGHNGTWYFWWGYVTALNKCLTDQVIWFGGSVSAICGMIGYPFCAGVAAISTAYLGYLNAIWGRGVYISSTWVGGIWVQHQ